MAIAAVSGQNGGSASSGVSSITQAFSSNVAVDNLVVVCAAQMVMSDVGALVDGDVVKNAGTATIDTISLAGQVGTFDTGEAWIRFGVWSAVVTGAGSLTMELDTGDSGKTFIAIHEFEGDWGGSREEGSNNNTDASTTTTVDSGDVTSAGDALFIGGVIAVMTNDNSDHTEDASFTSIHEQNLDPGGNPGTFATSFRISSGGLTDAMTYTLDSTGPLGHAVQLAVFKEEAGGATIFLPVFPRRRNTLLRM